MREALKLPRIFCQLVLSLYVIWGSTCACAQLFTQPAIVPTNTWPAAIFNADLRGSGAQDLFYVDYGATTAASTTHVLLNDGKGNFTPVSATIATAGTSILVVSMVDGGPIDLVWAGVSGHTATIYQAVGKGDGKFATPVALTSFPIDGPKDPVLQLTPMNFAADLKRPLLIEDKANGELYEVFQNPDATYGIYPVYGQPGISLIQGSNQVIAQDINGDGITDVLIQGASGVEVFPGSTGSVASIALGSPVIYPCAGMVNSMLLYDIDNDNIADLTTEGVNGSYNVYHGNANGTFSTTSEGGTATQNLDGTTGYGGHLIGVTTVQTASGARRHYYVSNPAGVSVLLGQGNVTYKLQGIYNLGPGRNNSLMADFNGDGYPDIAVDSPLGIAIGFGQADNSLKTSRAFATGQPAYSVAAIPFTGSGNVDAVVATGLPQIQVMANDGAGNFSMAGGPSPASSDETNAGRTLWSNVTPGYFEGYPGQGVAVAFDGWTAQYATTQGVSFDMANGTSMYLSGVNAPTIGESALGDFDVEGSVDLLSFDGTTATIYRGQPAASSMPITVLFTHPGGEPKFDHVATGYLKKEGVTEFAEDAVVEDGATFYIFANDYGGQNVQGNLTQVNTIIPPIAYTQPAHGVLSASGYFPGSVTLADLDGDGFGDLIISYGDLASDPMNPGTHISQTFVYWGDGTGQFSGPTVVTGTRNFAQSQVLRLLPTISAQLVSTDGYVVDVLPFDGRAPNAAAETQYLAGQGINGVVTASIPNPGKADLYIANGGVTMTSPVVNKGVLAKDPVINGGGLTVLQRQLTMTDVMGSVVATLNPVLYADNFTLTATIAQPNGDVAPTGTVTFSVAGAVVGTAPVVNGIATYQVVVPQYSAGPPVVAGYIIGSYAYSAVYSGDGSYNPLMMNGSPNEVVVGQPTISTIIDLDQSLYYGQEIGYDNGVDAELSVTAQNPGVTSAPLDGTLTVTVNGGVVCLSVVGVTQRCPDPPFEGFDALPNGSTYTMGEAYGGNDYYAPSSVTYSLTIVPDPTTTALVSSLSPSVTGQNVTFTATVNAVYAALMTAQYATPIGIVTFLDGNTVIGSGAVNAQGVATVSTATLSKGTHSITAQFAAPLNPEGAVNFGPSTSAVLAQVVTLAPQTPVATVTVLSSSLNPSVVGQSVTFTASVATTGAFVVIPMGSVRFLDGATVIGTATLDANGNASFSTSALTVGLHSMTAMYVGNSVTAASTSAVLAQQVNAALQSAGNTFQLVVNPAKVSIGVGNYVVLSVTVTEFNQFNSPVQLSCSGLPAEAKCVFGSTTIPAGGGVTTLVVSTAAPHNCGTTAPYFVASGGACGWLGLFGAGVLVFFWRKRRLMHGLLLVVVLGVLSVVSGCGNCTDLGTNPGSYSFTVTGSGGSVTQSVTIPMAVTI